MWFRDTDPDGRELVRDCEAFLAGRYVEYVLNRGDHVPTWAWTNLLAHGTVEQLRSPATTFSVNWIELLQPWLQARAYLAGEILDAAYRDGPLCRVQRKLLVPLELRLASDPATKLLAPSEWVGKVLKSLAPITSWKRPQPHS
ncbi:MAG TPA: hypothetical protein VH761_07925 [Ilumatobacteraceae bacterium]|jgi:hypothetical protein